MTTVRVLLGFCCLSRLLKAAEAMRFAVFLPANVSQRETDFRPSTAASGSSLAVSWQQILLLNRD